MTRARGAGGAGLPVLTYHAIGPERSVLATAPSRLAETLDALAGAGYRGVDLDDWVSRGRPDEPRGFALAFDDGLRSILRVADVVARHQIPATVFVVADRVGTDNAWPGQPGWVPVEATLTWSEIAELSASGFRFGSHGATHARLDRLGHARLAHELRASRAAIEDRTGRPCASLAYPYGWSSPAVRRAAACHYAAGFGTTLACADAGQDRFDLARVDAYYLRERRTLAGLIDGRPGGWLRWRRAIRGVRRRAGAVLSAGRMAG